MTRRSSRIVALTNPKHIVRSRDGEAISSIVALTLDRAIALRDRCFPRTSRFTTMEAENSRVYDVLIEAAKTAPMAVASFTC